ncbi:hypothetical protein HY992_01980 [Candidatus Micrarchaeota archaeon]|nr:hypothetical protein [Candidatus Micrarchaeota archaeon]
MMDFKQKVEDKIKFLEANVSKASGSEKARMEEELVVLRGVLESRLTKNDVQTIERLKSRITGLQKVLELMGVK